MRSIVKPRNDAKSAEEGCRKSPGFLVVFASRREIIPLEEILRRLDLGDDVRILEIETEFEHGRRVYEIEYLNRGGRIREILIDARSGEVLADEEDE